MEQYRELLEKYIYFNHRAWLMMTMHVIKNPFPRCRYKYLTTILTPDHILFSHILIHNFNHVSSCLALYTASAKVKGIKCLKNHPLVERLPKFTLL